MRKQEILGFVSVFALIIVAIFAVSQFEGTLTGFIVAEDFDTEYRRTETGERVFAELQRIRFGPVDFDEHLGDDYMWSSDEVHFLFEFQEDGTAIISLDTPELDPVDREGTYHVDEEGESIIINVDDHEIVFRPDLDEEDVYIYEDENFTLRGEIKGL